MKSWQDIFDCIDVINNVSINYTGKNINPVYKETQLVYLDSGLPMIEMYVGDEFEIIKHVYINGKEEFGTFENVNDFFINDNENNVALEYKKDSKKLIAKKEGIYKISSDKFGFLDLSNYNVNNYNDIDVLIVIKNIPKLVGVKWGLDNPLLCGSDSEQDINIKLIGVYDDDHEQELTNNFIDDNFYFSTDNSDVAIMMGSGSTESTVTTNYIHLNNFSSNIKNGKANICIKKRKISTLDDVILPEDLLVITYEDENLIDVIKKAEYHYYIFECENGSISNNAIIGEILSTFIINLYHQFGYYYDKQFVELSKIKINNKLRCNISNDCVIVNGTNDMFSLNKLGTSTITFINTMNSIMPLPYFKEKGYSINITITDVIDQLQWFINNEDVTNITDNTYNVTNIKNTLSNCVIIVTRSGQSIDITSSCEFSSSNENVKFINNDNDEVNTNIQINTTCQSMLSLVGCDNYNLPFLPVDKLMTFNMTIEPVLPEKIEIYEDSDIESNILNDTIITIKMLETKKLKAIVYPNDADYKEVKWISDNTDVATISENGELKIIAAGAASIYCSIKYPDRDIPEETEDYPDISSEVNNVFAKVNINALKIDVAEVSFDRTDVTLYTDTEHTPFYINVKPEGASIKDIELSFENDTRKNFFEWTNDGYMYVYNTGTGRFIARSVDNPEIKAELKVTGLDNTVKKVVINTPGNDYDYEFYDNYFKSPEIKYINEAMETSINKGKEPGRLYNIKNEKYDDDDFPRYYCPINNSIQLGATVEPSGAQNPELTWSSNGENLIVTKSGIVTPLEQTLEMENDDNVNDDSRFPNTYWITATNMRYKKSGVCQLRVFRNCITGIELGYPSEHDYDIDNIDPDGIIDINSEYKQDYVITRGSTIYVPITLTVQDPNFGPSNNIKWQGNTRRGRLEWDEIISLENSLVNHKNAWKSEEFDWVSNNPASVNNNKKDFTMAITGENIGSIEIQAIADSQYYTSATVGSAKTDENGLVIINDYKIKIEASMIYERICTIDEYVSETGNDVLSGNGYVRAIYYRTFPVNEVNVQLSDSNCFIITVPILTDDNGNELYVDDIYSDKANMIRVIILDKNDNPIKNAKVMLIGYKKYNKIKQILDRSDENGIVTCPSKNENDNGITNVNGSFMLCARPGEGVLKSPDKSRRLKIRVVDTPKRIFICPRNMTRIVNNNLPVYHLQSVWVDSEVLKVRHSTTRPIPIFIWFDEYYTKPGEKFTELLIEASNNGDVPLDDKYMSYAWSTSDPDIVKIIERTDSDELPESYGPSNMKNTKIDFNKLGYGRFMNLIPCGRGKATITIVNVMSGESYVRKIEVI